MRLDLVPAAHLGPPVLSAYATTRSLHVNVTLPLGPGNVSVGDIIRDTRKPRFKTEITYTLQITEPAWAARVSGHVECSRVVLPGRFLDSRQSFCHSTESTEHNGLLRHQLLEGGDRVLRLRGLQPVFWSGSTPERQRLLLCPCAARGRSKTHPLLHAPLFRSLTLCLPDVS